MNRAEIVSLTFTDFENSFQPGDRANPNWVTKCLYEYQRNPNPNSLLCELEQDIVWAALAINPDTSSWGITVDQYEAAMMVINPTFARVRAAARSIEYPDLTDRELKP
jgi:hypothetical protein